MKIHSYAKQGNIEGVRRQLDAGAAIDEIDKGEAYTPLMYAVTSSNAGADMVRFLIDNGADIAAEGGMFSKTPVLGLAAGAGNIEKVKILLDAGADVKYKRSHGYDILIDTVCRHTMSKDDNLFSLVKLFIEKGVQTRGRSDWGESAVRIASNNGRFDVVQLLLDAGADAEQLGWTELMYTIALGSLDDIRSQIDRGAEITARDSCSRTPWLLSLQIGDVEKAKLLLSSGANREDRGRCGRTPLIYPIINEHVEMLRWLLEEGFDTEVTNNLGETPLMVASEHGATECVRLLLEYGAKVGKTKRSDQKAISVASNLDVVRLLVDAGEDLNDIDVEMRRALTGLDGHAELDISKDEYFAGRHRQFGKSNPEVMDVAFWQAMIRCGAYAYKARETFDETASIDAPVWCFGRFGKSITELPDGRIIEIGGEHEDSYDPDFCIYNDVIVHQGDGTFTIYGYPRDVFAPTDFHSATLAGRHIYIIGCLGYKDERDLGDTPVYRLNIDTFKIEKVETTGEKPGWIYKHKAVCKDESRIHVSGGRIIHKERGGKNSVSYILDLADFRWVAAASAK